MTQRELQKNSPYLTGMIGYGFMLDEMNRIQSLLMADNSDALLKQEIENNDLLLIATKITRSRAIPEFKRYSRFSFCATRSENRSCKEFSILIIQGR